jgi:hypothetical protein
LNLLQKGKEKQPLAASPSPSTMIIILLVGDFIPWKSLIYRLADFGCFGILYKLNL